MDILEIMKARHSVRQYNGDKIESGIRETLTVLASECNRESGLNIQIIFDEPKCFDSMMAHYGKFSGVENYIALVGKKGADLDEKVGYYGEKLVLKAQELGLNTCWVAMTHGKSTAEIKKGEKLACIIALGYGATQGETHKNKPVEQLCNCASGMPDWNSFFVIPCNQIHMTKDAVVLILVYDMQHLFIILHVIFFLAFSSLKILRPEFLVLYLMDG